MTTLMLDSEAKNDEVLRAVNEAILLQAKKYSAELIAILVEEFERLVAAVREKIIQLQEYGDVRISTQAERLIKEKLLALELKKDYSDYLKYMESVGVSQPLDITNFDKADKDTKRSPRAEFKILKQLDIRIGTIITEDNGPIRDGLDSIPFERYVCAIKPNCHINLKHSVRTGHPDNFARHTSPLMMFFNHATGERKESLTFTNQ